jgi:hypothetical protein
MRLAVLRWLNSGLAVLIVFQLVSGLIPQSIPYALHRLAGFLVAAGIVLHVILNWQWIRSNLLPRRN